MNPYKIIDISQLEGESITEPVLLSEAKRWLKVTFSDDDTVITELITSARETIEEFCSISIVDKEIELIVDVDYANNRSCIEFELPYGPVKLGEDGLTDILVERKDGNDSNVFEALTLNEDYTIIGLSYFKFKTFCPGRYRITYPAGMTGVKKGLKHAVLRQIADEYENRGDSDRAQTICLSARQKAQPFKRMAWL